MSLAIRSTLFLGVLAGLTPISVAQIVGEDSSFGMTLDQGNGPARPPRFVPVFNPLGLVLGGYYGPNSPYVPNRQGAGVPYRNLIPGAPPRRLPTGQEGPGGLMLPHPATVMVPNPSPPLAPINSTRADELIEIGDRSFRGNNNRRAEERYKLALKANRESPVPHIHLAQVAIVRGDYNLAAGHLRDAVATTKGSGWLIDAPDIQTMYGEPRDFARQVARLESFLQTHPDDRNAWFVLGVEYYFSGKHQLASDAFVRVHDRRTDEALTAFLDAATVAVRRSVSNRINFPD